MINVSGSDHPPRNSAYEKVANATLLAASCHGTPSLDIVGE